jgi:hypothetical protein
MALYTYKCPLCKKVQERLAKLNSIQFCDTCVYTRDTVNGHYVELKPEMKIIPSVPSPAQWGCPRGF